VLVQVLSGAETEQEAARHERRARRRRLGDDGRVDADERARDPGSQLKPLGRLRDRPDHRPDERALALRVDPGVVVV
jgi:hypothetical protein